MVPLESAHPIQLSPECLQQQIYHSHERSERSERSHGIQGSGTKKKEERTMGDSSEWPVKLWGVNIGKGMWWDIKRRAPYYW